MNYQKTKLNDRGSEHKQTAWEEAQDLLPSLRVCYFLILKASMAASEKKKGSAD